jgi:hypothetical protein
VIALAFDRTPGLKKLTVPALVIHGNEDRNPDVREFYLGLSESGERRRYRDVKHYKRRKQWL